MNILGILLLCTFILGPSLAVGVKLSADPQDLQLLVGETKPITLTFTSKDTTDVQVEYQHGDVVRVSLPEGPPWTANATGLHPGHDVVTFNTNSSGEGGGAKGRARETASTQPPSWIIFTHLTELAGIDVKENFVRVTVMKSYEMATFSAFVGWMYFIAWSVSFYPQIFINYCRKSVVGLNFDFVMLNVIGFVLYSIFNCCLYWIPSVEAEYFRRHPRGMNPVQLNDIVFSLHAVVVTTFTIFQCFIYERGGQTVSYTACLIVIVFGLGVGISLLLSCFQILHWLDFLYICSYIKLTITLIKYIPQAFMNFKRKSTVGWSIGNVALDFTGGLLSMLQMMINADNYNDWESIFGDPTKFGLGLFSVCFDILFFVQHYILYRVPAYETIAGDDAAPPPAQEEGRPTPKLRPRFVQ